MKGKVRSMLGRNVGKSKKLKKLKESEHSKWKELRNENSGVKPHSTRPKLVKLVLRACRCD